MFFFLLGSILFPFILSTLRLVLNGPKVLFGKSGIIYWLAMVLCIPIYPIFLIMRESILVQASKSYKVSLSLLKDAKYHVSQFIQADLGLESHLQSVFGTRTMSNIDFLEIDLTVAQLCGVEASR